MASAFNAHSDPGVVFNYGTTTSVFYTQESALMKTAASFYLQKKEGGQESEQSEKSEIRIDK